MSATPPESEQLTTYSEWDTSLSFLHKQAILLQVPVRYVLIQSSEEDDQFIEIFDLAEHRNSHFTTIFIVIRKLIQQAGPDKLTLSALWEIISKIRGDTFTGSEIIPIWLHAIPEFQVNNPALFDQVTVLLSNISDPERYRDMNEVINYYQNVWLVQFNQEFTSDFQKLQEFFASQQEISGISPVEHSPLVIESVVISYDYDVDPGINILPDIFNSSHTSYIIPYIQYNVKKLDNTDRLYKIYKGISVDLKPNYTNVSLSDTQTSRGQTIYLNVWAGPEGQSDADTQEEARFSKKEAFTIVTISYIEPLRVTDRGIIRVAFFSPRSEFINEQILIDRIHSHLELPKPPADKIIEKRVGGNFIAYNIDLVEIVLFQLIMNDSLFSSYLYIEEGVKSFAEKKRLNIHYRGASTEVAVVSPSTTAALNPEGKQRKRSAVAAALTQNKLPAGEKVKIKGKLGEEVRVLKDNTVVLNIKITRATSRAAADQFIAVLTRLLKRYSERGQEILDQYKLYVPEYALLLQKEAETPAEKADKKTQKVVTNYKKQVKAETTNLILRKHAKEIFVAGYARKCQKQHQPLPISRDEVEVWKSKKIFHPDGSSEDRQVLYYPRPDQPGLPPNQPTYYFVCPDDRYPYPGLKRNKLKNSHQFPYLPCCYPKDQLISPRGKLNEYYKGKVTKPTKASKPKSKQHKFTTDKVIQPGRVATISTIITEFLSKYSDDESSEFERMGIPESVNSFIHCVALAMGDPQYVALKTEEDQEDYVIQLRTTLFDNGKLQPELLRQELFEMTNSDIIATATDPDTFFDPLLYYRCLEELYNCNIYIFTLKDQELNGNKTSLLQVPRHKYFHVHPPVLRPVVLILRHRGTESNALTIPQCELVVKRLEDGDFVYSYDESMNKYLYPALTFVARTLSWQIVDNQTDTILTCRLNLYSSLNYKIIFGNIPIVGQIIDTAGKARCFALAPEISPDQKSYTDFRILVCIPPTAPLNVREFKPEEASDLLPPYNKLIEFFGDPVSATTSSDGLYLTGLWFPLGDLPYGFYCPCQDLAMTEIYSRYPQIDVLSELASLTIYIPRSSGANQSAIRRIKYLRRASRFINQIINYLYLIAGRPPNISQFLNQITIPLSPQPEIDSLAIYNIKNIPRILPIDNSVASVLSQMAKFSPSMFKSDKLIIYDNQMYTGVLFQLTRYAALIQGLNIVPSQLRELQDYFTSKEDFTFNPHSEFLLSSVKEYDSWSQIYVQSTNLQQRTSQNLKDNIQTKLSANAFTYQEPYLYQHSTVTNHASSVDPTKDKFYIIQNVVGGELPRAIQVAYNWYSRKINSGFFTQEWKSELPPEERKNQRLPDHKIYRISPGKKLSLVKIIVMGILNI